MNSDDKKLKLVSGLSGSGKSVALHALEDIGYYCVDNLPIALLSSFAEQVDKHGFERTAVSIDSRNQQFLGLLDEHLKRFNTLGINYEFIFLDAEERVLTQRFAETRRTHPLMSESVSLLEAIRLEKTLLRPLLDRAEKHFDTTGISPYGLRTLIQEDAAQAKSTADEPSLLFKSFAYKRGMPLDADFVFDVRCLPNPYWIKHLRGYDGTQTPVVEYLSGKPDVNRMIERIDTFLSEWLRSFRETGRTYITVAIGCTGGRHRSVHVVEQLSERFSQRKFQVKKRHSELD